MWSLTYKLLASTIFIGALSGAGYGISKSFNKTPQVSLNKDKENIKNIKEQDSKDLEVVIDKKKEKFLKKKEVVAEAPKREATKLEISTENRQVDLKTTKEEIEEKVLPQKLVKKVPKINKLKEERNFDNHLEVEIDYEKLKEEKIAEEKKKSYSEKSEKGIFLEAIWKFAMDGEGSTKRGKSCILLKNTQQEKDISEMDMLALEDEIDEDSEEYACNTTNWYTWMEYLYEKEDLWIRGKERAIKQLIEANNDNWKNGPKFLVKDHKKFENINSKFDGKFCEIKNNLYSEDKDWLEIKCSSTEKPKKSFW